MALPILFMNVLRGKKISGLAVVMVGMGLIVGYSSARSSLPVFRLARLCLYCGGHDYLKQIFAIKGIEKHNHTAGHRCSLRRPSYAGFTVLTVSNGSSITGERVLLGLSIPVLEVLYFPQLTKIPVQRVAVFGYLEPLFARGEAA